jgi:hypothetical protein
MVVAPSGDFRWLVRRITGQVPPSTYLSGLRLWPTEFTLAKNHLFLTAQATSISDADSKIGVRHVLLAKPDCRARIGFFMLMRHGDIMSPSGLSTSLPGAL